MCTKYKEKLSRFSAATNAFINSSDNYRMSALKDHSICKIQEHACVENEIQKGNKEVRNMKITISQILSSCARFQSNERRQGKRLDQVI